MKFKKLFFKYFNKIDKHILYDEVENVRAPLKDYFFFYGINLFSLSIGIYYWIAAFTHF